jgi:uncharacterized repeat protein (TIGR03803 family)
MQISKFSVVILSVAIVAASLATSASALGAGSTEKVIYSFGGGSAGSNPMGALVAHRAGKLYGTTAEGGSSIARWAARHDLPVGTSSHLGWSRTETVLYRFTAGSDGAAPESNLIFDAAGSLYGTTAGGGDPSSDGTVFRLTPPSAPGGAWTETVLYRFAGPSDGKVPLAGLVFDQKGNLYGTTVFGGTTSAGIVFQLTPPATEGGAWTETVLHTFGHGNDGLDPEAGLIFDNRGALYGTTITGTVFADSSIRTERAVQLYAEEATAPGRRVISRKGPLRPEQARRWLANTGSAQLAPAGGGADGAALAATGGDYRGNPAHAVFAQAATPGAASQP